jgi:hypothetical protein
MCELRYDRCYDCKARIGHPTKFPCEKEACNPKSVDVRVRDKKHAVFCARCKQNRDKRNEKARMKEERKQKKVGEVVFVQKKGEGVSLARRGTAI